MFYKKLLIFFLVLANLSAVGIIFANYQKQQNIANQSKMFADDFISKKLIAEFVDNIKRENINRAISFGVISAESKNCFIDSALNNLKEKQESGETTFIYLPSNYSAQDIANFKKNLNVNFEIKPMSDELSNSWLEILNEKKLNGVIVSIKDGEIKIR